MMSRNGFVIGMAVVLAAGAAGCRTRAKVIEEPRADFQVEGAGGNRGFLVGTAPPLSDRKATRQLVETEVETPFRSNARPDEAISVGDVNASARSMVEVPIADAEPDAGITTPELPLPESYGSYTVKPGDTLSTIASAVYGDGGQWRRIFDANQEQLASPDTLQPGMALRIPQGTVPSASAQESTPFRK